MLDELKAPIHTLAYMLIFAEEEKPEERKKTFAEGEKERDRASHPTNLVYISPDSDPRTPEPGQESILLTRDKAVKKACCFTALVVLPPRCHSRLNKCKSRIKFIRACICNEPW